MRVGSSTTSPPNTWTCRWRAAVVAVVIRRMARRGVATLTARIVHGRTIMRLTSPIWEVGSGGTTMDVGVVGCKTHDLWQGSLWPIPNPRLRRPGRRNKPSTLSRHRLRKCFGKVGDGPRWSKRLLMVGALQAAASEHRLLPVRRQALLTLRQGRQACTREASLSINASVVAWW